MDETAHKCSVSALFVGGYEDERSLVRRSSASAAGNSSRRRTGGGPPGS